MTRRLVALSEEERLALSLLAGAYEAEAAEEGWELGTGQYKDAALLRSLADRYEEGITDIDVGNALVDQHAIRTTRAGEVRLAARDKLRAFVTDPERESS